MQTTPDLEDNALETEPGEAAEANAAALLERVVRDTASLASAVAARDVPAIRRTARDGAVVGALALALLTTFVLANVAVLDALRPSLSGWRAPLVLAAAWLAVAALAAIWVSQLSTVRRLREAPRQSVGEAEERLLATLEELTELVASYAERRIVSAVVPFSGELARTGEEVMDAADEVIEAADEITDVIERTMPGGVIVNRAADLALAPSRFGIRVVRFVFNLRVEETTVPPPP